MTSAQYRELVSAVPLLQNMFCSSVEEGTALNRKVSFQATADSNDGQLDAGVGKTNYENGFEADPFATNVESGGRRVLIGDINGMTVEATKSLFLRQHGGSTEFDKRLSDMDVESGGLSIGGYPYMAVIDWWDADDTDRYNTTGVFKKVICVKEDGNCTVGPDDETHGVEGSAPYWQVVNTYPTTVMELTDDFNLNADESFCSMSLLSSGYYEFTIKKPGLIKVNVTYATTSTDVTTTGNFIFSIMVSKGDKFSNANAGTIQTAYSADKSNVNLILNGKSFLMSRSNFSAYSNKTVAMKFTVSIKAQYYEITDQYYGPQPPSS